MKIKDLINLKGAASHHITLLLSVIGFIGNFVFYTLFFTWDRTTEPALLPESSFVDSLETINREYQEQITRLQFEQDSLLHEISQKDSLLIYNRQERQQVMTRIQANVSQDWDKLSGQEKRNYVNYAINELILR